jgi:hypothetical protein
MKALEPIDKQPIAERSYVKSHPYQTSCRLTAMKMLAIVLAGSLWIPRLAFSEDDKMGQMPTPAPMENAQAGQMNTDAIAGKLAELQNQLQRVETMLQERSQHSGGQSKQGQGMRGNMNADSSSSEGGNMENKGGKEAMGNMPQQAAKEMKQMPMESETMGMMGMAPTDVMKESALPGLRIASLPYRIDRLFPGSF